MAEVTWAALLDNFTKELYSGIITAEQIIQVPLLEALTEQIDRASFDNNGNIKLLIQTQRGRNARGLADGGNLPSAQAAAYIEQTVPVQRILATCGLTEKTYKLLTGGNSSWGPLARRTLDDMILDFKSVQNIAAHSNGNGALAVANGTASYTGAGAVFGDCTAAVITCDNEYWDTNIENTSLIQKDMYIMIWDATANAWMTHNATASNEFRVTAVAPGKRSITTWAATTGTLTIAVTTGLSAAVADGDIIFIAGATDQGTYGSAFLPMGLTGIIANNNNGTYDDDLIPPFNSATVRDATANTFQGLARATYPSLNADVWHATDWGSAGVDHTPQEDWSLSIIADAMDEVSYRGGRTRLLRCHPELARCLYRLSQSSNSVNVIVQSTKEAQDQIVAGDRRPKYIYDIEGELIPIVADKYCPRYMIEGLDTSVIKWAPVDNADFRKDFGGIWGPTRNTRATTIEAGYEWWYELCSERCDWHFRINDLAII